MHHTESNTVHQIKYIEMHKRQGARFLAVYDSVIIHAYLYDVQGVMHVFCL